jgi:hypothetical protein
VHAHTCLGCTAVLARGEFDCDYDAEHDFALCAECAEVRNRIRRAPDALDNTDAWRESARVYVERFGHPLARDADSRNITGDRVFPDEDSAVRWCALGHALRLGGCAAANDLDLAYSLRFRSSIQFDNDERGREYVRDRLLELANSNTQEA